MNSGRIEGRAFIDGAFRQASIEFDDGRITAIKQDSGGPGDGGMIVPGFIDLHVHGGGGADFMDASRDAVLTVARLHARHGTTSMAATTLSAPTDAISRAVTTATGVARESHADAAEIVAIHLEGPYLNRDKAGAQDRASIRPASITELEGWIRDAGGLPMIVTLAPEQEQASSLIARFRESVIFSIGHTEATFEEASAAIQAGARHFTHLFNAMPPLHHREPGAVGAAFASTSATVELIADGFHVHPALLRFVIPMLAGRALLVTDAMRAAGMPAGTYRLFAHEVSVQGGEARLADGTLAGSVLTMDQALKNMVAFGVPIEQVIPMMTEVPAARLGMLKRKGRIAAGGDADLVVLSSEMSVERVLIRGSELNLE